MSKTTTPEQIEKNQRWQENFLWKLADRILELEFRYAGNYYRMPYVSLHCHTCNEGCELHTAEGSLQWLGRHRGHNTWLDYMGMK